MSKQFRILGIKINHDCAERYVKTLERGKLYLYANDYEECENQHLLRKRHIDCPQICDTLYNIRCANGREVSVSISAIVGPNGCGKSTLVELILRLLNNLAFSLGFTEVQEGITRIYDLSVILYYKIDGHIYALEQLRDDITVTLYKDGTRCLKCPNEISGYEKYECAKGFEDEMFYTLLINYSLYAYNSNYFIGESEMPGVSWIDELFHKNDAYQTPIVINPMRDNGNINVNKEMYLSRQRLLALYTMAETVKEREVDEGITAKGYAFSLESFSKLFSKDLQSYALQTLTIKREWSNFDLISIDVGARDSFLNSFSSFVEDLHDDICIRNNKLWDWIDVIYNDIHSNVGDLGEAFEKVANTYGNQSVVKYCPDFDKIKSLFTKGQYKSVNITMLYRIYVIEYLWDLLKQKGLVKGSLNETISNSTEKKSPKASAMLYMVHKFLSIMTTYKPYTDRAAALSYNFDLLLNSRKGYMNTSNISAEVDQILGTHDYTTLKLEQTISYLRRNDDYFGAQKYSLDMYDYEWFVSFNQLHQALGDVKGSASNYLIRQIPPIFEGDIVLSNGTHEFPLSSLSSGMTQRLNIVGSFLYHLRNLDFRVNDANRLQYRNINVITEEVELYFHPEYQKSLVEYIRKQISMLTLENIEAINFIYVTHSPFILSDILKHNILCLRNGRIENDVIHHTFGANVFDIMSESFFLSKGAIGDFAQRHIHNIAKQLKDVERDKKGCVDCAVLFEKIMLVDEPIMRKLLLDKYYHLFPYADKKQRIMDLKKQLSELENDVEVK